MTEERLALLAIARKNLGFKTFEVLNNDRDDFREVAVWNVEKALEEAFQLGQRSK